MSSPQGARPPAGLAQLGRIALEASLSAATAISDADLSALAVETKATSRDLVTDLDRSIERHIVEVIRSYRPSDAILGEEYGDHRGHGDVQWLIDPIDGTTNLLAGRQDYAVAVAGEIDGVPRVGAIVKPATGEWIVRDEAGATETNRLTAGVSATSNLSEAVLSVGVSIDEARRPITLSTLLELLPQIRDFRRTGSTSCDLLAVATGSLDGYVGIGTKRWDVAAGWAAVQGAGGAVHRFEVAGGQLAYVLAVPAIASRLVSVVSEHAARFADPREHADPDIQPGSGRPSRPRLRHRGEPNAASDPELGL